MDSFVERRRQQAAPRSSTGGQRIGNKGNFYEPTVRDRRAEQRQGR
jgi:hypothetical protein